MNNLKKIRLKRNLTQKDIAKIINVSDTEVRRKETGVTVLNEDQIRQLCRALDVRADYLLGLTDEEEKEDN